MGERKIKRAGEYADNTEPWGKGKDQEWSWEKKHNNEPRTTKEPKESDATRSARNHTKAGCSAATRRHHAQRDNALTKQMKVQLSQDRERPHPYASDNPASRLISACHLQRLSKVVLVLSYDQFLFF